MSYEPVEIEWQDVASLDVGLARPDEIEWRAPLAKIIGYLIHETDDFYVIAKEVWDTGQTKYHHVIPKRSVIDIKKFQNTPPGNRGSHSVKFTDL